MSELVLGPGGTLIGAVLSDCRVILLVAVGKPVVMLNCIFSNVQFEYDKEAMSDILAPGCVFEDGCTGMEFAGFTRQPDGTAAFAL